MKQSILISLVWLFAFLRQPIQATETIKVACVGNSITYGTGITNRDAEYVVGYYVVIPYNQYRESVV